MKDIKPWMAVGALVAAGGLLVACGSSGGMTDATSDPEEMAELVEQGLAGEETVTCVVSGTDEGTVYLASEEQFRFDGEVDGESPSMVSTGDEVFIWVDGEDTGASLSGAEVPLFQAMMVDEIFGELSASDAGDIDECGVYTGGDGVFSKPDKVDFLTIESDADFAELEDSAPRLVDLMFD